MLGYIHIHNIGNIKKSFNQRHPLHNFNEYEYAHELRCV